MTTTTTPRNPAVDNYHGKGIEKDVSFTYGTGTSARPVTLKPYIVSNELKEAVRLALLLERPLLLKGEPGCGKSRLAESVAYEMFRHEFPGYFFEWHVKSTSKAADGLYVIDHLQRLRDANMRQAGDNADAIDLRLTRGSKYLTMGELGRAFEKDPHPTIDFPPVVLIDEIDKADIDFPNDLLLELEKMQFEVPDAVEGDGTKLVIKAKRRPLIIVTSNDEKPLPPAFLRRCLFHYIDFRDIKLDKIIKSNYANLSDNFIERSIGEFTEWRKAITKKGISNKNISTSEMLDWMKIVDYYVGTNAEGQTKLLDGVTQNQAPPYVQALLKDVESLKIFIKEPATTGATATTKATATT